MKISKLLVVGISMLVGMAANAKNMISIHTDNVQLVLGVKSNGRIYQAYLAKDSARAHPSPCFLCHRPTKLGPCQQATRYILLWERKTISNPRCN